MNAQQLFEKLKDEPKEVLIACAMSALFEIANGLEPSDRYANQAETRISLNVGAALTDRALESGEDGDELDLEPHELLEYVRSLLTEFQSRH